MSETYQKPLVVLPGPDSDGGKAKGESERRADTRFPFSGTAEVIDKQSGTRLLGRTSDLSASGCYIDTMSPFAKGTVVRLRLEHDQNRFETTAVVTYSLVPMGMGLIFTETPADQLDILKGWMPKSVAEQSRNREVAAPTPKEDSETGVSNPRLILYELIHLMVRKKLITENEGAGLLRQMFR